MHNGFLWSYNSLRKNITAAYAAAKQECPTCTTHVVGHSLGASQALLFALDISLQQSTVDSVFTFGCPRTGDPVFAQWWDSVVAPGRSVRSVHYKDIVPHVPPHDLVVDNAFTHTHRELWQTSENGSYVLCNANHTKKGEDPDCSFQYSFLQGSISDHTAYYGVREQVTNPCAGSAGPCLADGACTDAGESSSCCSGRTHSTSRCKHGRCGCLVHGLCADKASDCCSGKGHKTLKCPAVPDGVRCDA